MSRNPNVGTNTGSACGFIPVALVGLLLFVPCMAFLPVTSTLSLSTICPTTRMCASEGTPWGVATSLFLFDGPKNMVLYGVLAMAFVEANFRETSNEKLRRSAILLASSFGAAIGANYLWMSTVPAGNLSFGQSGVVYSFFGTMLAVAFSNGLPHGHTIGGAREYFGLKKNVVWAAANLSAFGVLALMSLAASDVTFSSGPNMNVYVHEMAFVMGFAATLPYYVFSRMFR